MTLAVAMGNSSCYRLLKQIGNTFSMFYCRFPTVTANRKVVRCEKGVLADTPTCDRASQQTILFPLGPRSGQIILTVMQLRNK